MALQDESLKEKWQSCLSIIKDITSINEFETWFTKIEPMSFENSTLYLLLPSDTFKEHIETVYGKLLWGVLQRVFGSQIKVFFRTVVVNGDGPIRVTTQQSANLSTTVGGPSYSPFAVNRQRINSMLNQAYTFDDYIEGKYNKMARKVGIDVATKPGKTFNPMFIYGASGLGKTHLAHAIGLLAQREHPEMNVLYVSADSFTTHFMEATRDLKTAEFCNFFQSIDFLIIDDVQGFASKTGTQNVFFNIFNQLHQTGKQIILTSDQPPKSIPGVDQRIISRFNWGITVALEVPDNDTRIQILKHKIEQQGLSIPEDVVSYIAQSVTDNIRDLEGVVTGILGYSTIYSAPITMEVARKVVSTVIGTHEKTISISDIKNTVCSYFNLDVSDIQTKSRKREVVQARQIAMYLARKYTKNSLQIIGEQIGGRDHATVLHALKAVKDLSDTDKDYAQSIANIEKELR